LKISEQVFGSEHLETAEILENYATLLGQMKREDEAKKLMIRVMAIQAIHSEEQIV